MPGYKVHGKISLLTAATAAWGMWILQGGDVSPQTVTTSLAVAGGTLFGGTLGSPDLDIPSTPYNHWRGMRFLWLPWQIGVSHRSPLSHWPILGTMAKFVYIVLTVALVTYLAILGWNITVTHTSLRDLQMPPIGIGLVEILRFLVRPIRSPYFWLFLLGDTIGMTIHDITDYLDGQRRRHYRGAAPPPLGEDETQRATRGIWER